MAVYAGQFAALFGLSFSRPFLPIFLGHELGVSSVHQLAFWTAVSSGVLGLGIAVAGPIWGVIADRVGRKPMLVRAMLGGTVTVGLMAFSRSPTEYTLEWFLFGALSSTAPVAIALMASETPREHVAYAMGMIASANSLGNSIGPAVAGVVASTIGLRSTYLVGALIEGLAIIPILLLVRESGFRRARARRAETPGRSTWRLASESGALKPIVVLLVAQALFLTATESMRPIVVLRLLHLSPEATLLTGVGFGLAGLSAAAIGAVYSRFAVRAGYRRVAIIGAGLGAMAIVVAALASSPLVLVATIAFLGLVQGSVNPSISTMLGMETPLAIQGTVFGFIATANAVGLAAGPFLGGGVAAAINPSAGILTSAAVAGLLVLLFLAGGREPIQVSVAEPGKA